jgi:hypothetical protein
MTMNFGRGRGIVAIGLRKLGIANAYHYGRAVAIARNITFWFRIIVDPQKHSSSLDVIDQSFSSRGGRARLTASFGAIFDILL